MILVTVGSQLPFDRLIKIMDEVALDLNERVFAQVGKTNFAPKHITTVEKVAPAEFNKLMQSSRVIVSHAGIGSILTAQKWKKPIVIFPRRAALGEHRNDHQLATVAALKGVPGVYIANTSEELRAKLIHDENMAPSGEQDSMLRRGLISGLKDYLNGRS